MDILNSLSWLAAFILTVSFIPQIILIQKHKETRDLSVLSFAGLAVGSMILMVEAVIIGSNVFIAKNIGGLIMACIIIYQIRTHGKDKWKE